MNGLFAIAIQSLTPEIIQQNYIDALKDMASSGNVVVIPEGTTPIVNTK